MLTAKDVRKEVSVLFDSVQVDCEGYTYVGHGLGRWQPDIGLSVDASMRCVSGEGPARADIGLPSFHDESRLNTIRLRTQADDRAVIFLLSGMRANFGLLSNGHLDLLCPSLITWKQKKKSTRRLTGCLHYDGRPSPLLPDAVSMVTRIGERKIAERYERGLNYEHNEHYIIVLQNGSDNYTISWGLPEVESTSSPVGEWPRAIALAWQLLSGRSVWPIASEFEDGRRQIVVLAKREDAAHLGHFSLVDSSSVLSGEALITIAQLFAASTKESDVARRLLAQCFDASRAKTWQAVMFLLSTALEAVLRSLYAHPFAAQKKNDSFRRSACLKRLFKDYFDDNWKGVKRRVEDAFERVRHRSAHPDWLQSFGGAMSPPQMEETFNDLVLISRFYGYLILHLARVQNLKPSFPVPVAEWKPVMKFSRGGSDEAK